MNRRYLEPLAVACLTVYAALVFSAHAVHGLPGMSCHCHSAGVHPSGHWQARNSNGSHDSSSTNKGRTSVRRSGASATDPDIACPICRWFKMAHDRIVAAQVTVRQTAVALPTASSSLGPVDTRSAHLPRGPPILAGLICAF